MSVVVLHLKHGDCFIDEADWLAVKTCRYRNGSEYTGRPCDLRWYSSDKDDLNYAHANVRVGGRATLVSMHRLVAEVGGNIFVDHRDFNGLNNTSDNLRPATHTQNMRHRRVAVKPGFYRGIRRRNKRWGAQITVGGKSIWLGRYDTAIQAALAYDRAAVERFGEYAVLNFPLRSAVGLHHEAHNLIDAGSIPALSSLTT